MADSGDLEKILIDLKNKRQKVEARIRFLAESGDFFGGVTRLHVAAQNGYLSVCEAILEYAEDKNPRDSFGWTPLHLAAQGGHLSICKLLMKYAEDKHPTNSGGMTPLDVAAECGHRQIICFFLSELD